jgi:ferredoxin--NADP+ reductase
MEELNCVVTNIIQVSPNMKIMRVQPVGWELPEYKSGQFVAIGLLGSAVKCAEATQEFAEQDPDKIIKRAYSIASSSTQNYVEFYITLVHSGSLTPRIFALNIGDKLWMGKKAVGMFTLDEVEETQNVVLIATGTGVAPYMSMLRSNALTRKGKVMVIHGASNSWDLGYSSELHLLESMFDNFIYYPTITMPEKEPVGWGGDARFVQDIWTDKVVEKKFGVSPKPENTHVFLCGNPKMTEIMSEILEHEGFVEHSKRQAGQIHIEKF